MLSKLLITALLCALVAAQGDHCAKYTSCKTCVAQYLCGWCSLPVVYPGNVTGAQCAGFDPKKPDPFACNGIYSTEQCVQGYVCDEATFTCKLGKPGEGTKKTVCEANCTNKGQVYLCNMTTHKCYEVPPGTSGSSSLEQCEAQCIHPSPHPVTPHPHPAKVYACNYTTGECVESKPGKGASKEVCEEECKKGGNDVYMCNKFLEKCIRLPPGAPGESLAKCEESCQVKPNPGPPPYFLGGMWRGIAIQQNYRIGEWDMDFTKTSATIVNVREATTIKGIPFNVENAGTMQLWINVTSGPGVGKVIKGIAKQYDRGPETFYLTAAFGQPGGEVPKSIHAAMTDGTSTVFFLSQCAHTPECIFTMPSTNQDPLQDLFSQRATASDDRCSVYGKNCSYCLSHKYCGWCSEDVVYKDGVKGTQCAGFSTNPHVSNPFVCQGRYSTFSCNTGYDCDQESSKCVPNPKAGNGMPLKVCEEICKPTPSPTPAPPQYVCNITLKQCFKCNETHCPGSMPKETCESACVKPHHGPSSLVVGMWRGIQISNNYPLAEYDLVFNASAVTSYKNKKAEWSGSIESYGGDVMIISVTSGTNAGKKLSAIYSIADQSGMYSIMTLAVGKPDGTIPGEYSGPMHDPPEYEQVLAKCLQDPCKFHTPS